MRRQRLGPRRRGRTPPLAALRADRRAEVSGPRTRFQVRGAPRGRPSRPVNAYPMPNNNPAGDHAHRAEQGRQGPGQIQQRRQRRANEAGGTHAAAQTKPTCQPFGDVGQPIRRVSSSALTAAPTTPTSTSTATNAGLASAETADTSVTSTQPAASSTTNSPPASAAPGPGPANRSRHHRRFRLAGGRAAGVSSQRAAMPR